MLHLWTRAQYGRTTCYIFKGIASTGVCLSHGASMPSCHCLHLDGNGMPRSLNVSLEVDSAHVVIAISMFAFAGLACMGFPKEASKTPHDSPRHPQDFPQTPANAPRTAPKKAPTHSADLKELGGIFRGSSRAASEQLQCTGPFQHSMSVCDGGDAPK